MSGLDTLKAYGVEGQVVKLHRRHLSHNQRAFYWTRCLTVWLQQRLMLLGAVVVFSIALSIVIMKSMGSLFAWLFSSDSVAVAPPLNVRSVAPRVAPSYATAWAPFSGPVTECAATIFFSRNPITQGHCDTFTLPPWGPGPCPNTNATCTLPRLRRGLGDVQPSISYNLFQQTSALRDASPSEPREPTPSEMSLHDTPLLQRWGVQGFRGSGVTPAESSWGNLPSRSLAKGRKWRDLWIARVHIGCPLCPLDHRPDHYVSRVLCSSDRRAHDVL